ncbi:MRG/MORF4L-binding protein [Oopsacas minuta]|uniref:MRG/MORF4L-binding protein n=1 Tax=Oopsacas minuta TaxID=111878 RepID=A0AAV7JCR3_9METZ|nr:MRG/MORF4L-binding protein [Oopsacas minuta]
MSKDDSQITTIMISEPNSLTNPESPHSSTHEPSADKSPPTNTELKEGVSGKELDEELIISEVDQKPVAILTKIDWTPELDLALLYALQNHKLVGSNKYFHMLCIHDAFSKNSGILCTVDTLWDRVSEWYDLDLLAGNELNPFPLSDEPNEFSLPPYFSHSQPPDSPILLDSEDEPASHRLRSVHRIK